MSNFSLRDGDNFSQDPSLAFPKNFNKEDGVPVMKVGLNDPHVKSIVMSRTEFSAEELEKAQP